MGFPQAQVVAQLQVGKHGKDYTAAANRLAQMRSAYEKSLLKTKHRSNQNGTVFEHSPVPVLFPSFTRDLIDLDQISTGVV